MTDDVHTLSYRMSSKYNDFPSLTVHIFMPGSNDRGILFLSCLFVYLFVACLSVNFNLCYNFNTVRDRDFIFGMHTTLKMSFQITPRLMTL